MLSSAVLTNSCRHNLFLHEICIGFGIQNFWGMPTPMILNQTPVSHTPWYISGSVPEYHASFYSIITAWPLAGVVQDQDTLNRVVT